LLPGAVLGDGSASAPFSALAALFKKSSSSKHSGGLKRAKSGVYADRKKLPAALSPQTPAPVQKSRNESPSNARYFILLVFSRLSFFMELL
jgi:hypothetical protein